MKTIQNDATLAANTTLDEAIKVARAILAKLEADRARAEKRWDDAGSAAHELRVLRELADEVGIR